ncbi:hypothetical protein [Streptomyces violascens]|uniref:hypothetical protein n=1 Tax=Streptomyces violascens TaxID=67381 RepID=UPI0016742FBE|nr:hypothetical protein [Streptomyces violascens]GGU39166.1 hypothetical protein GCM10010289_70080 [Streptomyces violascens]
MSQDPQPGTPHDPVGEVLRLLSSAAGPANPMVLLDGPPLSGVSRTVYEALQTRLPHARLYQLTACELADACTRPDVSGLFGTGHQYVVWLDGLSPADLVLLGQGVLDQVLPRAVVMASVNSVWYERILQDRSAVTAPARTVLLEYAQRVSVPFTMTARERSYLRENGYPVGKGLAESLVGGENLVKRYRRAARANPDGHLLVQAAVDVRRCGIHRPLSEDELHRLWHARSADGSDARFQRALEWASAAPEDASTGLLFPSASGPSRPPGAWRVLGYAAGADDGDHGHKARPLDQRAWEQVQRLLVDAGDQYALGIAAHLHGRDTIARAALTNVVDHAGPEHPLAAAAASALRSLDTEDCD